jgi:hypothetical protein
MEGVKPVLRAALERKDLAKQGRNLTPKKSLSKLLLTA